MTFDNMKLQCYETLITWNFYAMKLICFAILMPWNYNNTKLWCHESTLPWNFDAMRLWCHKRHCWILNRHWQAAVEIFLKSSGKSRSLFAILRWIRPHGNSQRLKELLEIPGFMMGIQQVGNQTATIIALCNLADFDLTAHFCQVIFCFFSAKYFSHLYLVRFCFFGQVLFPFFCRCFSYSYKIICCFFLVRYHFAFLPCTSLFLSGAFFAFLPSTFSSSCLVLLDQCFYAGGHYWCRGPWGLGKLARDRWC